MTKYGFKIINEEQFQAPQEFNVERPCYNLNSESSFSTVYKGSCNHLSNNQIENSFPKNNLTRKILQNSQGIRTNAKTKD
mgnify:FL=1